jgi:hypothetical protein
MATYKVKVGKDLGMSLHSATCRVVVNGAGKQRVFQVEADSAKQAKSDLDRDNDMEARGLPLTKICGCCGEG